MNMTNKGDKSLYIYMVHILKYEHKINSLILLVGQTGGVFKFIILKPKLSDQFHPPNLAQALSLCWPNKLSFFYITEWIKDSSSTLEAAQNCIATP